MSAFTPEQAAELKMSFENMDGNKDGFVTKEEFSNLIKSLGEAVTDEVVDELI